MFLDAKRWLQIIGGSLMLSAITKGRQWQWHYHWEPKTFFTGMLIFLSTFITWKRKGKDDDSGAGPGA